MTYSKKFDGKHEPGIRDGSKRETIRPLEHVERIPEVGEQFVIHIAGDGVIGVAEVQSGQVCTVGDVVEETFEYHRNYDSVEEFAGEMAEYYPDMAFDSETEVLIIFWGDTFTAAEVVLPTDPKAMELTENNAPRVCDVCGDPADWYVIITDGMTNERLGTDLPVDEWPVNSYLCRDCFADAPRVKSWEALI